MQFFSSNISTGSFLSSSAEAATTENPSFASFSCGSQRGTWRTALQFLLVLFFICEIFDSSRYRNGKFSLKSRY